MECVPTFLLGIMYTRLNSVNLQEEPAPAGEQSGPLAPKTAKQLTAKRNHERVKSILLLAIPDEYLYKFHNVPDAKSLWDAIKSRFQKLISYLEVYAAQYQRKISTKSFISLVLISNMLFLAQQTTAHQLENEDLQLFDQGDIEELELNAMAMLTVTGKENSFRRWEGTNFKENNLKEPRKKSNDFEIEPVNYALMAISSSSSSSSSDNERKKINNLNLELDKVVKEIDELKLKIEKWKESSKNLDELLNSQMSARDNTGLGYGTQLNEMSNNSETDSEISLSVFDVRSSDEENTQANDRFSKADGFHAVPPPIIWNFLTPKADISFAGLDEYAIRKKIIE
ncbi:hypothetical protein Tco_0086119 [Tanacetum coccineum]